MGFEFGLKRKRSSSLPLLVYYKTGENEPREYYCPDNYRRRSTLVAEDLQNQNPTHYANYYKVLKYHFNARIKYRIMPKLSEKFGLKKSLFLFVLDWISDVASGIYYFMTNRWIEGVLTWLIVFGSGCLITFGFLSDKENRKFLQNEAVKYGKVSFIFLYCPSWFPFFCYLIRLHHISIEGLVTDEEIEENKERRNKMDDLSLKSMWSETVFEAKPQLLLQIVFLLETTANFSSPFDYLPICTSIISLLTATNAIYTYVITQEPDSVDLSSKWSLLWGLSYTGVSVTAPAFSTNILRHEFEPPGYKLIITITSLAVYFIVFEIVYELSYLFSKKLDIGFSRCYYFILPLFYISCFATWIVFQRNYRLGGLIIISTLFIGLLVVNCVSYYLTQEFSEICFKMKNDKIDDVFQSIQTKFSRKS